MGFDANHDYMMLNEPFESNYEDLDIHLIKHGLGFSRLCMI